MSKMKLSGVSALLAIVTLLGISCNTSTDVSREENQRIAEEFVKAEATFQFDGMPDTLEVIGATAVGDGWEYTLEFDCRHAGYGNRSGQLLAEVITHHTVEITVQDGLVKAALMDGRWDMINQRFDVEIKLAPIDEVKVNILKSNPPQISVYIKGGLSDGCTTFHDIETLREDNTINIEVTVKRPAGVDCPAIYTTFEKEVNLGSDFVFGTTYTLKVNDYTTTFNGTLVKAEGFAIFLTREGIPPDKMEMLSRVDIADQAIISIQDIITYNAQTHEIKLTDEAFERIANLEVPVSGTSFLVCVNSTPIYWGAFWTPVSSIAFEGITIWKPLGSQESKVITLELGYPSSAFYQGEDPRNNPAILASLEQSGKLINKHSITSVQKLPHSLKGYELYSWEKDGEWHFTFITGTDRTRMIEEIISEQDYISENSLVKVHVVGVDATKDVLSRLPEDESVFWCDELHIGQATIMDESLQLPPEEIASAIEEHARQCEIDLIVTVRYP